MESCPAGDANDESLALLVFEARATKNKASNTEFTEDTEARTSSVSSANSVLKDLDLDRRSLIARRPSPASPAIPPPRHDVRVQPEHVCRVVPLLHGRQARVIRPERRKNPLRRVVGGEMIHLRRPRNERLDEGVDQRVAHRGRHAGLPVVVDAVNPERHLEHRVARGVGDRAYHIDDRSTKGSAPGPTPSRQRPAHRCSRGSP